MRRSEQGALPAGWTWTTFEEITEGTIDQGGPDRGASFLYVDISSIDNQRKAITAPKALPVEKAPSRARQRLLLGDVLVSMTRPNLNAVAIVPPSLTDAVGSTGFHVLRSKCIAPGWLFYLVQTTDFVDAMSYLVQGALYPAVRPKDIRAVAVPIAPLPEQHRILTEIETQFTRLDAAVAALERTRANLKRYRAAILAAACSGRLVPTEAELARAEGREYEAADQLLARILLDRREKWEADQRAKLRTAGKSPKDDKWRAKYEQPDAPGLAEGKRLPEGWVWATVEQLSTEVQYGTSAKTHETADGVPVLRMGNIVEGRLDLTSLKFLPSSHEEFPDLLLSSGDVLFNRTNSAELVGKTAVYRGIPNPCSFASYLIRVRRCAEYLPDLLAYYVNSTTGREWVRSVVNQQVGQANVNGSKLKALAVPLPPLAEQHRIVAEVERRLSVVEELEAAVAANLKRAERMRQAILKRAFEGKLVPQDPSDEPASALLERIRAERGTTERPKSPRRARTRNGMPASLPLFAAGRERD